MRCVARRNLCLPACWAALHAGASVYRIRSDDLEAAWLPRDFFQVINIICVSWRQNRGNKLSDRNIPPDGRVLFAQRKMFSLHDASCVIPTSIFHTEVPMISRHTWIGKNMSAWLQVLQVVRILDNFSKRLTIRQSGQKHWWRIFWWNTTLLLQLLITSAISSRQCSRIAASQKTSPLNGRRQLPYFGFIDNSLIRSDLSSITRGLSYRSFTFCSHSSCCAITESVDSTFKK